MTRSTLEELLARCERATGEDWEIDAALARALGWTIMPPPKDYDRPMPSLWVDPTGEVKGSLPPHWTGSLDAIVGLIETQLPEANCVGFDQDAGGTVAYVSRNDVPIGQHWYRQGEAATRPLAFCAAFLRAKLSSPGGDE